MTTVALPFTDAQLVVADCTSVVVGRKLSDPANNGYVRLVQFYADDETAVHSRPVLEILLRGGDGDLIVTLPRHDET